MTRHIRQYHDLAVSQTLEASQRLFDDQCTQRIWKMMNSEFMMAKEAILESEGKKTVLHAPTPSSSSPLHSLVKDRQPTSFHEGIGSASRAIQFLPSPSPHAKVPSSRTTFPAWCSSNRRSRTSSYRSARNDLPPSLPLSTMHSSTPSRM